MDLKERRAFTPGFEQKSRWVKERLMDARRQAIAGEMNLLSGLCPELTEDAKTLIRLSDGVLPWEGTFLQLQATNNKTGRELKELRDKWGANHSWNNDQRPDPDKFDVNPVADLFYEACAIAQIQHQLRGVSYT